MKSWEDPRIVRGMTAQLAKRRERIAAGETPLGWKVGFGAPASMQRLGLQAPLVGYLMQAALLPSGSSVSIASYSKPVLEPEIAVRMARDLPGGSPPEAAGTAVKELMPAIELADLDPAPTPDNLDLVLEGDIFQRQVLLCSSTRPGASVSGLTSRLIRRGAEVARTTEPEALTGKLVDLVAHVASTLAAFGERLAAGDIIITGSITPAVTIERGEVGIAHALDPIGEVSVKFTWA